MHTKVRRTGTILFLLAALCLAGRSEAYAQSSSTLFAAELPAAQQAYAEARYESTVRLVEAHLRAPAALAPTTRVQAYRLQGLSYSALGEEAKAREAVKNLVLVYPSYEPSPEDSKPFTSLMLDAQQRHARGELNRPAPSNGRVMNIVYGAAAFAMSAIVIGVGAQDW